VAATPRRRRVMAALGCIFSSGGINTAGMRSSFDNARDSLPPAIAQSRKLKTRRKISGALDW